MALPCGTTGSLRPAFAPARLVSLAVKLPYAFTLVGWFPISLREPSRASVTLWEATAPVKLPTMQGPRPCFGAVVRYQNSQKRYFTDDSIPAGAGTSKSPAYATYGRPNTTAKL